MLLYNARQAAFVGIVVLAAVALAEVWGNTLVVLDPQHQDRGHVDSVLGTAVQTTSAVGGVALALTFITAQLSSAKGSVLRELYRSADVHVLVGCVVTTLLAGYAAMAGGPWAPTDHRMADTTLVLAVASVLLVPPVLMLQLENFNPATLAAKLADRISPRAVIAYGLSDVRRIDAQGRVTVLYRLNLVGIRTGAFDPLRPMKVVGENPGL